MKKLIIFIPIFYFVFLSAQDVTTDGEPIEYVYHTGLQKELKGYVFNPSDFYFASKLPAIVIFHGGGWVSGEPAWAFSLAEKFAKQGMVAIAAEYRLSDQISITPIDAMEDARNVILWMKQNAEKLNINPEQIAAMGWSAGAHLAACTAVFPISQNNISSVPNILVLVSPALSLAKENWFQRLLIGKGERLDYSPAEHLKENMPASIIVLGKDDTVTPTWQSILFETNMHKYGNECELHIYDGVGHMFTPSGESDKGTPNPDKEIQTKAYQEIELFLRKKGYIK